MIDGAVGEGAGGGEIAGRAGIPNLQRAIEVADGDAVIAAAHLGADGGDQLGDAAESAAGWKPASRRRQPHQPARGWSRSGTSGPRGSVEEDDQPAARSRHAELQFVKRGKNARRHQRHQQAPERAAGRNHQIELGEVARDPA